MSHALKRTNRKGEPFVGRCIKCGEDGLRMPAAFEACPADRSVSDEEAMLEIIEDKDTAHD